jgi:hypothetical protein
MGLIIDTHATKDAAYTIDACAGSTFHLAARYVGLNAEKNVNVPNDAQYKNAITHTKGPDLKIFIISRLVSFFLIRTGGSEVIVQYMIAIISVGTANIMKIKRQPAKDPKTNLAGIST